MPTFTGTSAHEVISINGVSETVFSDGPPRPGATDDLIYGGDGVDHILAGAGADTIFGDSGNDFIYIEATTVFADGGLDIDALVFPDHSKINFAINLGTGGTNIPGHSMNNFEIVYTADGNDTLVGSLGDDLFFARAGNDFIDGLVGSDSCFGEAGNDTIAADIHFGAGDGGVGIDTLDTRVVTSGFSFNLATGLSSLGSAIYRNFENLTAGVGNDSLTGTGVGNAIYGGRGDDAINGGGGLDSSYGGSGDDYIVDVLGVDIANGGKGQDYLDASLFNGNYAVNLTTGRTSFVGESFLHFEILVTGSGNDTQTGNAANNQLVGGAGNDLLLGKAGNDLLSGQSGLDTLMGGTGNDLFTFALTSDSPTASPDVIRSNGGVVAFEGAGVAGGDKIDLSLVDADEVTTGDQAFVFNSSLTGGVTLTDVGRKTLVRCNTDLDADFELAILIEDGAVTASDYGRGDFTL